MATSCRFPRGRPRSSLEEVAAVIAYLQTLGGQPSVTVADVARPATETAVAVQETGAVAAEEAAITDAPAILATFNCLDCHSMEREEVLLGPPFDTGLFREVAAAQGMSAEAYLMQSIVDPRAVEREAFPPETMPDDYGQRLSAAQLHTIVGYLLDTEAGR